MATVEIELLKQRFESGDIPTGSDFSDLIDTLKNAGQSFQPVGSPVLMSQGSEIEIEHSAIVNERYQLSVSQEAVGESGLTNVGITFAEGSEANYVQEDQTKTEFVGGKVKLRQIGATDPNMYINIVGQQTAVNASSTNSTNYPSKAVNGNPDDPWIDNDSADGVYSGTPPWFSIEFATPRRLGKFKLNIGSNGNWTSRIDIQVSSDNLVWNTIQSFTDPSLWNNVNWPYVKIFDLVVDFQNQVYSKYYRLQITQSELNMCFIRELVFYENAEVYDNSSSFFVTTNGSSHFNASQAVSISSLSVVNEQPVGTSIKCLVSFDNRITWKYFDGVGWTQVPTGLEDLQGYGNTITALQTGFSNFSTSGIDFIDFAFDLKTTDVTKTPSIDYVSVVYTSPTHYELSSHGSYSSNSEYGVKRISPTKTLIKKMSSGSNRVFATIFVG